MKKSLLLATVVLIGVALIVTGVTALVAPQFAASAYGIMQSEKALAYVRATGVRDLVIGCFFILLVIVRAEKRTISVIMLLTTVIPVADAINVWTTVGTSRAASLALHSSSVLVFVALGVLLWREAKHQ